MKLLKYVIFRVNGALQPVVWPAEAVISHKGVSRGVLGVPMSAGFCWSGKWQAFDKSESLNLASKPEDSELLVKYFGEAAGAAGALAGSGTKGPAASPIEFSQPKT